MPQHAASQVLSSAAAATAAPSSSHTGCGWLATAPGFAAFTPASSSSSASRRASVRARAEKRCRASAASRSACCSSALSRQLAAMRLQGEAVKATAAGARGWWNRGGAGVDISPFRTRPLELYK